LRSEIIDSGCDIMLLIGSTTMSKPTFHSERKRAW